MGRGRLRSFVETQDDKRMTQDDKRLGQEDMRGLRVTWTVVRDPSKDSG